MQGGTTPHMGEVIIILHFGIRKLGLVPLLLSVHQDDLSSL